MNKKPIKIEKLPGNKAGAHVRKNLKIYWGKENPKEKDAIEALEKQLLILSAEKIASFNHNEWFFAGAESDWIQSGLKNVETVEDLFKKGSGFPEAGGLSLRSEYFIFELAVDLILWRDGEITILKGHIDNDLETIFRQHYPNGVAIAFRGNAYADC